MPRPKTAPKRPAAPEPEPETRGFHLRGLTPADHEALERAAARRAELIGGGNVSKTQAALAVLRAGLAAEDLAGHVIAPPKARG